MTENEARDAVLPAPVPGGPEPEAPVQVVTPDVMAATAADDQQSLDNSYNNTVRSLREQPLVRVRVPKEQAPLYYSINGYKNWLAEGVHMVPKQVAELLEDAGRV